MNIHTETGDIEAILKIAKEREAERIIVGLPRLMNGDIGPQAQKVQAFTEAMRSQTNIPIEYRDERLTTVTAQRLKQETGEKEKRYHSIRCDGGGGYSAGLSGRTGCEEK